MANWMGLDSGGTEQLWDPEVLVDILTVMQRYAPFSRIDPASPIFDDLEMLHPDITWINTDKNGEYRTVFRKVNPIVKLGLSTPETENASLTDLGTDVLSGATAVRDVFAIAAQAHTESDGTKSMAQMCRAALMMPEHVFTAADVEFGVSEVTTTLDDLPAVITRIRQKALQVTGSTRPRRIRSFMNALVRAGALAQTKTGWVLHDTGQARKIAQSTDHVTVRLDALPMVQPTRARRVTTPTRVVVQGRKVGAFDLSKVGNADPVKAAIALERSNQLHEDIVAHLGLALESLGHAPVEDSDSFDLAILHGTPAIFEVKTINAKNAVSQIRKAIIQLEEYRWRHRDLFTHTPQLFIALSQNPTSTLEPAYFDFIETDRGMSVIWPEPQFVDRHQKALQTILAPQP